PDRLNLTARGLSYPEIDRPALLFLIVAAEDHAAFLDELAHARRDEPPAPLVSLCVDRPERLPAVLRLKTRLFAQGKALACRDDPLTFNVDPERIKRSPPLVAIARLSAAAAGMPELPKFSFFGRKGPPYARIDVAFFDLRFLGVRSLFPFVEFVVG